MNDKLSFSEWLYKLKGTTLAAVDSLDYKQRGYFHQAYINYLKND